MNYIFAFEFLLLLMRYVMSKEKILIAGAGIAGLALAQSFKRAGIAFKQIEKRPRIINDGAGIALPANAIAALRHLGLEKPILAQAHPVNEIIYTKASGEILSRASLLTPPLNKAPFVALHRCQLH